MPGVSKPAMRPLVQISADTVFPGTLLPDLGLSNELTERYRVYVLECEPRFDFGPPCYYLGITTADNLVTCLSE